MQTSSTLDASIVDDVERVGQKEEKSPAASEKSIARGEVVVQPATHDYSAVPEGGLHGWLTLIGVCLFQFCTFGYVGTFGVYQDYYVRIYLVNYTPDQIGWIGGMQIFLLFSLGAFSGSLFDRGFFKSLFYSSVILQALACNIHFISIPRKQILSGFPIPWALLWFIMWIGVCSLIFNEALSVLSHYFRRRRPLAMGIASASAALGGVLHPIMLNRLVNGSVGFHNGVRISAALNVFLLVVASSIMRPGIPPPAPGTIQKPKIKEFFRDPPYVAILIAGVLMCCGIFFALFFLQLDAVTHGVSDDLAFYAISIQNAASIFGRTIPGVLTHRFGVFKLMAVATFGTGITALCMAAVKDATGVILFAIFYGFFSGGAIALAPTMIAMISKDVNEIGTRIGIYFFFGGFLALFAIPIAGALLTDEFHWVRAVLFAGFMLWGAGVFYCISGYLLVRRQAAEDN